MNDKDFCDILRYIFKGAFVINLVIYLLSLIFEINISVLLGLLLGTGILYINLHLLRRNLDRAVNFGNNKGKLMSGYLLRYLLIASAFYFATKIEVINPFGIIVPQLYPKVLYTFKSIRNKKGVVKM